MSSNIKSLEKSELFHKFKYLFVCILLSIIFIYLIHLILPNSSKIIIGFILGYFIYIKLRKNKV